MKKNVWVVGGILISISVFVVAKHSDVDEQTIIENRIKPIGKVHILPASQPTTTVLTTVNSAPSENKIITSKDTNEIYTKYCSVCHAPGIAGAPKFRDPADWKSRMPQGKNVLLEHVTKGLNAMPPKGTCATCTPEELKAAIEYMVPK